MFIVVFVVMLPVYLKTQDPVLAWQAGLAWAFVIGVHHPARRLRRPDRAQIHAARGDAGRARRHFDRLHLDAPGVPELAGAVAVVPLARHHPGELDRAGAAAVRPSGRAGGGAGRHRAGLDRDLHRHQPADGPGRGRAALGKFGLHPPIPSADLLQGLADIAPLLVTAVPLGIYNFTEGMNNVESASAAGDEY